MFVPKFYCDITRSDVRMGRNQRSSKVMSLLDTEAITEKLGDPGHSSIARKLLRTPAPKWVTSDIPGHLLTGYSNSYQC